MDKQQLRCPCGGKVEERGNVRYYAPGIAYVAVDGHREFVTETWRTPIETLTVDDPPFYCVECDRQWALADLVVDPFAGTRPIRDWHLVHIAMAPDHLVTACGVKVGGYWQLDDHARPDCPKCLSAYVLESHGLREPERPQACPS